MPWPPRQQGPMTADIHVSTRACTPQLPPHLPLPRCSSSARRSAAAGDLRRLRRSSSGDRERRLRPSSLSRLSPPRRLSRSPSRSLESRRRRSGEREPRLPRTRWVAATQQRHTPTQIMHLRRSPELVQGCAPVALHGTTCATVAIAHTAPAVSRRRRARLGSRRLAGPATKHCLTAQLHRPC